VGLFDVHAHLTHPKLRENEGEILARAAANGLTTILSNGLNPSDNVAVKELAARAPIVKPCFGFYPVDTVLQDMEAMGVDYPRDAPSVSADEGIASVRALAEDAFAIGEIGLDGYWVPEALWGKQEQVFRALVTIAQEHGKAIIIHTRKRERRALEVLTEMGVTRVDWHCFGGRVALAREIAARGHHLSIPANARRHEAFTRILETVPRTQILLETDCPYLGPVPGEDSEPSHVTGTHVYAAELWKCSEAEAKAQLEANFEALFGVPP
jgi:TatD DNase family protein